MIGSGLLDFQAFEKARREREMESEEQGREERTMTNSMTVTEVENWMWGKVG